MANITNITLQKHLLKNDNGEYISPVVSAETVYLNDTKLPDVLKQLESGSGEDGSVSIIDMTEIKSNLNNINSDIGETTDSGGTSSSGSINAKLNALISLLNEVSDEDIENIKSSLETNLSNNNSILEKLNKLSSDYTTERANKIDTIDTNIGVNSSDDDLSLFGKLNNLKKSLSDEINKLNEKITSIENIISNSTSVIKSIQRGYSTTSTVSISNVDPKKCIVILNPTSYETYEYDSDNNSYAVAYGWAYNGWSALKSLTSNSFTVEYLKSYSWQIIEFN